MSEERLERIGTELRSGLTELRSDLTELRSGLTNLGLEMRVLHEDLKSDIKALRPEGPSRTEVRRWDEEIRQDFAQRLDPLEATVRYHSEEIERLKQGRS